jgi:hypothetical protein
MADPELWHAIHRLAVVIKHMDVDDRLGVEMDGLLDMVKGAIKSATGAARSLKDAAFDNNETPPKTYVLKDMEAYSVYVDDLTKYTKLQKDTVDSIKLNDTALSAAKKAASQDSKSNKNRSANDAEQARLGRLQAALKQQKDAVDGIVKQLEIIIRRYKQAYNEFVDYEFRVNGANAENETLKQHMRSLENAQKEVVAQSLVKDDKKDTAVV